MNTKISEKEKGFEFIFKNDGIGFNGKLLGTFTNTAINFGPYGALVEKGKMKKICSCSRVGELIDIPKYTSNFICVLETHESKVFSFLSLGYKKKNKLLLALHTDFALTSSETPLVYKKDNIGEYDIYENTDKIYADCIHALILAKERKDQIQNERKH